MSCFPSLVDKQRSKRTKLLQLSFTFSFHHLSTLVLLIFLYLDLISQCCFDAEHEKFPTFLKKLPHAAAAFCSVLILCKWNKQLNELHAYTWAEVDGPTIVGVVRFKELQQQFRFDDTLMNSSQIHVIRSESEIPSHVRRLLFSMSFESLRISFKIFTLTHRPTTAHTRRADSKLMKLSQHPLHSDFSNIRKLSSGGDGTELIVICS